MYTGPYFTINPGSTVLHRQRRTTECKAESQTGIANLDEFTAASMLAKGEAQQCEHCTPAPMGRTGPVADEQGAPAHEGLRAHEH